MNKFEFTQKVAERMSITHTQAKCFLNTMEDVLKETIKEDKVITFQGFGTFSLWKQVERQGRNPKTGEPSLIPARNSIKFKPGKQMLNYLNDKKE